MKAILSDIHGNLEALESVLKEIKNDDLKMVIILGDLVDYGADSAEVVKLILDLKRFVEVVCVRGNHDDAVIRKDCSQFRTDHGRQNFEQTLKDLDDVVLVSRLESLLFFSETSIVDYDVTLLHATQSDKLWGKSPKVISPLNSGCIVSRPEGVKVILGGHSHIQGWTVTDEGLYINPGSVGQPRNGDPRAQFIICNDNFTEFEFRRIDYDTQTAASKIRDSGRPDFLSTRILLGI